MAEDDDVALVTGCCVIHDPNAPGGVSKFDGFTEKACREAAQPFGLPWNFYPGTSCSSV
jgi:hypothetical protein